MDFLNVGLLAGAGLAAVPVVLHLVMRQQPRHIEFPALRFVQSRKDANRRKLQLRHLLLLLLRMAAIGLLAFALARPSFKSTGVIGDQEAPLAAALVVDTAPRMDYRHQNQSRLEAAREIATGLIAKFPQESQVAVVDSARSLPVFQVDVGAAGQRLSRLETTAVGRPLWQSLADAAELLAKSDLERKEMYVFTDLSQSAWDADQAEKLREQLAKVNGLGLYIVDVGIEKPQNYSLGDLRLSSEILPKQRPWSIGADVGCVGEAAERVVEVYLLDADGKADKRGQESVKVAPGAAAPVEFSLGGLDPGAHQGYLRLVGADGLAADDRRYFTVEVKPAWKVLVAAAPPAEERALYLTQALAPEAWRKTGQARFECQVALLADLPQQTLEDFAAVALLDPHSLTDDVWKQLGEYVRAGGGLAIFLGPSAEPQSFNAPAAQALLPGPLEIQARFPDGDLFLTTDNNPHPLLARFKPLTGTVPWDAFPIYRYWQLGKLAEGVGTVLSYANQQPVLLERPLGQGRALTMTTPISEGPEISEDNRWNRLPSGFEPWPFLMLADQMFLYLVGSIDNQLNYAPGQVAVLKLDHRRQVSSFLLATPWGEAFRQPADPQQHALRVSDTHAAGNYRVRAGGAEDGIDRGFSVNLPPEASDLARTTTEHIEQVLGETPFRVAHNPQEIDRDVTHGRMGRELFPIVMALVAVALALEQVLANRFYRKR